MEQDILRTDKKECPKCGSKNVKYLGTGGGTKIFKVGRCIFVQSRDLPLGIFDRRSKEENSWLYL